MRTLDATPTIPQSTVPNQRNLLILYTLVDICSYHLCSAVTCYLTVRLLALELQRNSMKNYTEHSPWTTLNTSQTKIPYRQSGDRDNEAHEHQKTKGRWQGRRQGLT